MNLNLDTATSFPFEVGVTIGSRHPVGEGGAGWVLRAALAPRALNAARMHVGIKIARAEGEAGRALLRREAIARAIVGRDGGPIDAGVVDWNGAARSALVFSWVEGVPLEDAAAALAKGRATPDVRARFVDRVGRNLAAALARLHGAGFRHGDVKPANVLVRALGQDSEGLERARATLIDLSLAAPFATAWIGGTPAFLAPEVLAGGFDSIGDAADVFALGRTVAWLRDAVHAPAASDPRWAAATSTRPGDRSTAATLAGWSDDGRPLDAGYLVVRWRAIERAARAGVRPGGAHARPWIEGLCRALTALARDSAAATTGAIAAPLVDLSAGERRALVAWIAGPGAETWRLPAALQTEDALLDALERAQRHGRIVSPADLVREGSSPASPASPAWPASRSAPVSPRGASASVEGLAQLASAVARVSHTSDDEDALRALASATTARARARDAHRSLALAPDDVELAAIALCRRSGALSAALALATALLDRDHADRNEQSDRSEDRADDGSRQPSRGSRAIEAADLARACGDLALASALLDGAGDADEDRADRTALRARIAFDRGGAEDRAEARAIVEGATDSLDDPRGALDEMRGLIAWSRGAWTDGVTCVERALGKGHGIDAERRARLTLVRGMLLHGRGDAAEAIRAFQHAADLALALGSPSLEASARSNAAAAANEAGCWAEGLAASERAIALLSRANRVRDRARTRLSRVANLLGLGRRAEALDEIERTLADARQTEDRQAEAYARWLSIDAALLFEPIGPDTRADGETCDAGALAEAARSASAAIEGSGTEEERLYARGFTLLAAPATATEAGSSGGDRSARDVATSAAAWTWWRARLRAQRLSPSGASHASADPLEAVLRGDDLGAPPAVVGPALAEAIAAARRVTRGDAARALSERLTRLVARVSIEIPAEHRAAFDAIAWVASARSGAADGALAADRTDALALSAGQIELLASIARGLRDRTSMNDLLRQVVDGLVLWVGVERGLLLLRAPAREGADASEIRLVPRVARGLSRDDLADDQLALSTRLARRALETLEPVVMVDAFDSVAGDARDGGIESSIHALRLRSVLAVPLVARGDALGVVYLDDRVRRGAFGPREVAWVRLLATQAAAVIADARDAIRLKRLARKAERAQARLEAHLAHTEGALAIARVELARTRGSAVGGDPRGTRHAYPEIVGDGPAIRRLLALLDRITDASDARIPVLIQGESGTGKELVARAVHANGARKGRAFVAENCGAIPETLLETTLFGHVRGAFTGADRPRAGLFEVANGGTLFLDEVGEMGHAMQAKLLRAVQDGEIRPVGSNKSTRVDVRVVAATHRDLEALVQQGKFREDLFYRIAVITVRVPALRDRPEDIPLLITHLVRRFAPERDVRVTRRALAALAAARWPGNIRQLENELRRALVVSDGTLDLEHLSSDIVRSAMGASATAASNADASSGDPTLRAQVDALEARLVSEALRRANGNQTKAALALGLSRFGLQKMLKRLGVGLKGAAEAVEPLA